MLPPIALVCHNRAEKTAVVAPTSSWLPELGSVVYSQLSLINIGFNICCCVSESVPQLLQVGCKATSRGHCSVVQSRFEHS